MVVFYLVCCLLWFALVLCNVHFASKEYKVTGWNLFMAVVIGVLPFINTLFLALAVVVAYQQAKAELK